MINFMGIRPGDRVRLKVYAGRNLDGSLDWAEREGRAVIVEPGHAVVNVGRDTPQIADHNTYVSHRPGRAK